MPRLRYKLLVLDLDGTAITRDGRVTHRWAVDATSRGHLRSVFDSHGLVAWCS